MKMKFIYLLFGSIILMTGVSPAQFIWNDAARDASYTNPGNWVGNTAPTATGADIEIETMVNSDFLVGIDTFGNVTVNSWRFDSTLTNSVDVVNQPAGQQLTITGTAGITNASNLQNEFDLVVNAGSNMSLHGGSGGLYFQDTLDVSHFNVTTTGTVTVDLNQPMVFEIDNTSNYGSIGSVVATGAIIDVVGNGYTGNAGDTFDLTSGNFNGATLGVLPNLSPGLTWNTSELFSNGILSVQAVPEPSTYVLLLASFLLLGLHKRRSKVGSWSFSEGCQK